MYRDTGYSIRYLSLRRAPACAAAVGMDAAVLHTPPPRRSRSYGQRLSDAEGAIHSDSGTRRAKSRYADHASDPEGDFQGHVRSSSTSSSKSSRSASKRGNRPPVLSPTTSIHANGGRNPSDMEGGFQDIELNSPDASKSRRKLPATGWRPRPLTLLAICTVLFGPLGTFLTFLLLPDDLIGSRRHLVRLCTH